MARECMDPWTGGVLHFPRIGGWHDQDPLEMAAMRQAWRTAEVFGRAAKRWSDSDREFVKWMDETDG